MFPITQATQNLGRPSPRRPTSWPGTHREPTAVGVGWRVCHAALGHTFHRPSPSRHLPRNRLQPTVVLCTAQHGTNHPLRRVRTNRARSVLIEEHPMNTHPSSRTTSPVRAGHPPQWVGLCDGGAAPSAAFSRRRPAPRATIARKKENRETKNEPNSPNQFFLHPKALNRQSS